jgi:uncharacterized membrane protein
VRTSSVRFERWRGGSGIVNSALLTGLGLAAPAGLNAYLPLLILAMTARFTSLVKLDRPYDFLDSWWAILLILVLLTVEIVVDKIPGLDHLNDIAQSATRPAAGALVMMATTFHVTSINPAVAMVIGLVLAGSIHAAKALTRPVITLTTGGLGNPIVSLVEDAVAALTSLVAILAPQVVLIFLVLFAAFLIWAYRRIRRFRSRASPSASATLRR